MEPRALRRKKGRHEARSVALAVLSATVLATGTFAAMLPATQAIGVAQQEAGAGLRSLSSAESLDVSHPVAALGAMTAGVSLHSGGVLTVRNTAMRTLQLDVSLAGAPGLAAEISPSVLEPGERAEITVSGTAHKLGELRGYIIITALDGFVRRKLPLTGEVDAPLAEASPPASVEPMAPPVPAPAPAIPPPPPTVPAPAPVPAAPMPIPTVPLEPVPAIPTPVPIELFPAPPATD